jgi:membrane protein required for colicin V production
VSTAGFNGFDWFVLVVLALSALLSLWRGFAREALSLGAWIIAFVAANLLAPPLAAVLGDLIANATGRYIVAWACIFVAVLLLGAFAAKLFSRLVAASGLGLLDRLLGTVFGALRGLLLVMVIVFLLRELVPPAEQDWLRQSRLMPHIDLLLDWSLRAFDDLRSGRLPGFAS